METNSTRVVADPATMRQGPGPFTPRLSDHRFAFLSDAHIFGRPYPCQRRVLGWAGRQIFGHSVQTVVLGGDLTHHASMEQAEAFIDAINIQPRPTIYLPGNNETTGINPGAQRRNFQFIRSVTRLDTWPGHAFALATTNQQDAEEAVNELAGMLPNSGTVLVIAHFPPALAGQEAVAKLAKPGLRIEWICGHQHQGLDYANGSISVHVCGGLDPIKVRNQLPEILICDWDGRRLSIHRHQVGMEFLRPAVRPQSPLGLAYRGEPTELLETALKTDVPALQFRWADIVGRLGDKERSLIRTFRRSCQSSFLSLHLPSFTLTESGVDIDEMEPCLGWATDAGIDDLTVHLPSASASRIFNEDQSLKSGEWVEGCLSAYTELARRAIAIGAQLSMENVYNKSRVADHEEVLSSRPWHLLRFVEEIRTRLGTAGYQAEQITAIGIIFDSGHAFRDPKVSKVHGLADWLQRIAPYLQLAHVHQTIPVDGKMKNHQPIESPCSAQINHAGLLPAFAEATSRPIPLLIEVRSREGALVSLRSLREIQAQQ